LDGFVKSSNSRRENFAIIKSAYRTLNDCGMQHNTEVGLFTKPSIFNGLTYDDMIFIISFDLCACSSAGSGSGSKKGSKKAA